MSFKEKALISLLGIIFLGSFLFWIRFIYLDKTVPVPATGGEYAEGLVGQPVYINPLLSQTSEADGDLVQLVFSGLLKYDQEGNLVNDLVSGYEISEDKRTYTFHLRQDAAWHDGTRLTADDVKFTVDILQDPAYKSPLRQGWKKVEKVEKIDDYAIAFTLQQPYFGFLNELTLGILPKHIWDGITPEKFTLADYNLRPIGSGPFMFSSLQKNSSGTIASISLVSFPNFYGGAPYISRFDFDFYPDEDSALEAYNNKEVSGLGNISLERLKDIKSRKSTIEHESILPRYFAVFFNQTKSVALANDNVRKALALSVDRKEIIRDVLSDKGEAVYSPILPQMKAFNDQAEKYLFNPDEAIKILEDGGWKMNEEKGVREKNGTELKFTVLTIDWPELSQTADILERQWEKIGAQVEVEVLTLSDIQQNHIRPREYEALLFGQESSFDPDLFPYWHSDNRQDPGLNFSLFDNKRADQILEEVRQESNEEERIKKYQELQTILAEKLPAVFLYSPHYVYPVSDQIKGIGMKEINSPSARFSDVDKWHINTRRIRK